jgi:5'-nucleotidase
VKKLIAGSAVIAAALSFALPDGALAQSPTPVPVTIIHVNDTHSHLDATGPRDANLQGTVGGIARAASLISRMKAEAGGRALFVHGGDAFHGDVYFNALYDVPELMILKQLGVDAMAVGNHEFDFTPMALAGALSKVQGFPMVSANLGFASCGSDLTSPLVQSCYGLRQMIRPGFVKTVGGVPVGLFALTTPSDATMQPAPVQVLPDLVGIAQKEVEALRADGAKVVVLLSHLGRPEDEKLLAGVTGIDVVIGAHDHLADGAPYWFVAKDGRRVPGVSAGSHYQGVGRLRLTYADGAGVSLVDWALVPVDASVPELPPIAAAVAGARAAVIQTCGGEDFWSQPIGYAPFEVSRDFDPDKQRRDTAMGNLVTDALRDFTGTNVALAVKGLIGEGLSAGPIVADDAYRPVSYGYTKDTCYGFKVATFEIKGADLIAAIEKCLLYGQLTQSDTYDVQASGLRFKYDSSRPPFARVITDSVHVDGHRLDPAAVYTVTANEGIAGLLPGLLKIPVSNVRVADEAWEYTVLRDYIRALGSVEYTSEARIRDVAALPSADNR